jgi:murein DD-endopeptidase MepM/ murein hydrolase activator NlpD
MFRRFFLFILLNFILIISVWAQGRYIIMPEDPRPGEPVTIGVTGNVKEALLFVNGRQLARSGFFYIAAESKTPGFFAAVLTVPSTARPGDAVIRLNNDNSIINEIPITIAPREFASETIHLTPVLTEIRTDPSQQRTDEANLLWSILTTTGDQVYHTGPFLLPVLSTRRTSAFGDRRVFQYSDGRSDTSIHAGVDFGVPTGTRVDACGTGRVVLSRMRIVTGNSVVIEHAPGIYSLYYHLDSIDVNEGDIVKMGTQIGLSGSTGLSTGPHLHWEIRVNTENTDPDALVHRMMIDKNLILSRIYEIYWEKRR